MRDRLNDNPVAQIAVIAVLAVAAAFLLLTRLGGGESESAEAPAAPVESEAAPAEAPVAPEAEVSSGLGEPVPTAGASGSVPSSSRPLPPAIDIAYREGKTIVLLIHRSGGIDDRLLRRSARGVERMAGVALFTIPVDEIPRYTAITGPLGVDQAPALVAIAPRSLNAGGPAPASVHYGFHGPADVRQAVIDAGYRGPRLTYAPD